MNSISNSENHPSLQDFVNLDLESIGLNLTDFQNVLEVNNELTEIGYLSIAEFGKDIASKTSSYSDGLLALVNNKELDETGKKLNQVISVAQQLNDSSLLTGKKNYSVFTLMIDKFRNFKNNFHVQFSSIKEQIDSLIKEIEISQAGLKTRVDLLEQMFIATSNEHHQLGIYIAAGQLKIKNLKKTVVDLCQYPQSNSVAQEVYDLTNAMNNLDKRVNDLMLLQQASHQMLPMIRIIQSNNVLLINKFFSIKNITIPAWKNQITMALSLNEQKNSVALVNNIDDTTNGLLRRNAELLQDNSIKTAKANQRAVIDIETLEFVQNALIKTVQSAIEIQKEGVDQRNKTSKKLFALKGNLEQLLKKDLEESL